MSEDATARHALPNLYVGQSQKEVTHNEALARIDALLHPVVEGIASAAPEGLTNASDGLCWLIGNPAVGQWMGRSGQIARWSGGSWRYITPVEGMTLWLGSANKRLYHITGSWIEPASISGPTGGTVIDSEVRAVVIAILDHLKQIATIPS